MARLREAHVELLQGGVVVGGFDAEALGPFAGDVDAEGFLGLERYIEQD